MAKKQDDLRENLKLEKIYKEVKDEALKAILETIATTSSKMIREELERALSNEQVVSNVKNNLMPYLYAACLLSFAGA